MAKYKVPSQASSGKDTFSDNLVGLQITDGSSQLTNSNFSIDKTVPEKETINFKTEKFTDFFTLDNISENQQVDEILKFKNSKDNGNVSLFGSLKTRINSAITNILKNFPSGFYVDKNLPVSSKNVTAYDITYDLKQNITKFNIETSLIFNPFEIKLFENNVVVDNQLRDFNFSYKNYILIIDGNAYNVINYIQPNRNNFLTIWVEGKPFINETYDLSFLIKPKELIIENFFNNLNDLESILLNRETKPLYNAKFTIQEDNEQNDLIDIEINWPLSKDLYHPLISGVEFNLYIDKLNSIADSIDRFKSNLLIRFLSSPQLFEFDTEDKKIEAIFQIYGQNFDKVKKFIDNIAFMRNISYDGINNLPEILLKNLSNTLGFNSVNLLNFNDDLYKRNDSTYENISVGKTLQETEYEFYRRLLVNLAYIYKSKGTRKSLEFFLKFIGAPEPLINIDEYIYKVTNIPIINQNDKEDLIKLNKKELYLKFNEEKYIYELNEINLNKVSDINNLGVKNNNFPNKIEDSNRDIFFQKGSGWYNRTLEHTTPIVLDTVNSDLSGIVKIIKKKNKSFSFGEEYFDELRNLYGLNNGFSLESQIDNLKINNDVFSDDILNRKNLTVTLSASKGIEFDFFRKSSDLLITFGTIAPQTGTTFINFIDNVLNNEINNSNVIKYKKNYPTLENIYKSYYNNQNFIHYNYIDINEFITNLSPYWVNIIEQFIPATTLWVGGNLIDNTVFGRSKYQYKIDCSSKVYTTNLFLDFTNKVEEFLTNFLQDNLRGLVNIKELHFTPYIILNKDKFIGKN